jgi:hypothetical protein
MSDLSQDSGDGELTSQARQILEELRSFKDQAEALLKQAESARKNADSEALLAFNAKKACEEHATSVANLKGAAEADANALATNKQRADEALAALNMAKASVDGDVKVIDSRRKEVDQAAVKVDQAAIGITGAAESCAIRLREIEVSKEVAETQAKAASKAAADASSAQESATKSSAEATRLAAAASEEQGATSAASTEIQALLAQARAAEGDLDKVLSHIAKSDEIAIDHEKRVEVLTTELQTLIERVEGLLPGATSAGLASSFNKQRSRFTGPQKQWFRTFIGCIGLLVVLAIPTFLTAVGLRGSPADLTWNAEWLRLALRLPIVLPIIWLAIYAGRNYMMSLRMEEDYAYKEAISTAFEGYKREMEKIVSGDGENPSPITILCANILRAISERPGRIYEGKQEDINLISEIRVLVEKSADLSKKQLAGG